MVDVQQAQQQLFQEKSDLLVLAEEAQRYVIFVTLFFRNVIQFIETQRSSAPSCQEERMERANQFEGNIYELNDTNDKTEGTKYAYSK